MSTITNKHSTALILPTGVTIKPGETITLADADADVLRNHGVVQAWGNADVLDFQDDEEDKARKADEDAKTEAIKTLTAAGVSCDRRWGLARLLAEVANLAASESETPADEQSEPTDPPEA